MRSWGELVLYSLPSLICDSSFHCPDVFTEKMYEGKMEVLVGRKTSRLHATKRNGANYCYPSSSTPQLHLGIFPAGVVNRRILSTMSTSSMYEPDIFLRLIPDNHSKHIKR